jgi:hypothetical protein
LVHFGGRPGFFPTGSSGCSIAHCVSVRSARPVAATLATRSPVFSIGLVDDRSTGDLVYLINDTPIRSVWIAFSLVQPMKHGLAHVQLLLGERDGRVRIPVGDLPGGVMAVSVPVRRDGEARAPRDRRRRLKIGDVDLISDGPTSAYDPPTHLAARELIFVLEAGRREWSTVENFFGVERAWDVAIALVRCGGVVLRCGTDENLDLAQPIDWRRSHAWSLQHADLLNDLRGRPNPDALRAELVQMMAQIDELRDERTLLSAYLPGSPLRVPKGSATGTEAWSVYENVIRAAAVWWTHRHADGERLTAKGLASKAFRNSKGWTAERELAFSNLLGISFDQAVSQADTDVRVRGPLVWRLGRVAADAGVAEPWISLPAKGLHAAGIVRCTAEGVLLVENSDTFEQICRIPEIVERWLCVWGKGHISDGVVALLSYLALRPVVAWCDLDADGIGIIDVLARKLQRPIRPVGMGLDLWRSTPHRLQKPKQIARDKALATRLAAKGPEPLRALAQEIATYGGSCEQEAIQDLVLPDLAEALAAIVRPDESGEPAATRGPGR